MIDTAQFSKEELELIELFQNRIKELQNTKIMRGGTNLNFDFYDDLTMAQKPESLEKEELIKSFLMSFRYFYLNKEPTNFGYFHNRIFQKVRDPKERETLSELRKRFKQVLRTSGGLAYYYKGERVTPEKMIGLWFTGHYFHSDTDARSELDNWLKRAGGIFQFLFLDALKELAAILIYYSKILNLIIEPGSRAT
ncbi:MAG: hypothetical protein AMJ91_07735 [candidate division Zixibacteria bacterium SM23_73_3]|nr:MAG: hypothetical protein AMJ91_07735 [candidate division Zixibacteria bacterium SM23_73_3]